MGKFSRDIILLMKDTRLLQQAIELEVTSLHEMIATVETVDAFCKAHELVARNKITSRKFKMLDAIKQKTLRPFYFLINKN